MSIRILSTIVAVAALAGLLAVAGAQAGLEKAIAPEPEPQLQQLESDWNATANPEVGYDHMYRSNTRAPSFNHMFAKPRPQHF